VTGSREWSFVDPHPRPLPARGRGEGSTNGKVTARLASSPTLPS
jgi:hypothetical protein